MDYYNRPGDPAEDHQTPEEIPQESPTYQNENWEISLKVSANPQNPQPVFSQLEYPAKSEATESKPKQLLKTSYQRTTDCRHLNATQSYAEGKTVICPDAFRGWL